MKIALLKAACGPLLFLFKKKDDVLKLVGFSLPFQRLCMKHVTVSQIFHFLYRNKIKRNSL